MGTGISITTNAATGGLAYVPNGTGTNVNGGLGFSNMASVGTSQGLYFFTPTANSRGSFVGNAASYAFADTVSLSSTGLSVTPVAAVPEPGEWLLMMSGFGLIGFIANRRKGKGSMAFA